MRRSPSCAVSLVAPSADRTEILRALTAQPASADLALIAMADTDEVVRLRLLRAIRDLGANQLKRHSRIHAHRTVA